MKGVPAATFFGAFCTSQRVTDSVSVKTCPPACRAGRVPVGFCHWRKRAVPRAEGKLDSQSGGTQE